MPSRMERYYRSNPDITKRTSRNQNLYKKIYEDGEYTNIEGIASIGSTNEVDITKIKEMLKNREDYRREKNYRTIVPREEKVEIPVIEENEEERTYDIRDILSKAKTERTTDDHKYRSLKNTQYNILKNLQMKDEKKDSKYLDTQKEEEELKELIHTITSTSMLNQLNDRDLCLNLFEDLKSSGDTMTGTTAIRKVLEEERLEQQEKEDEEEKIEMDRSFFTSSLGFGEKDFEDLQEVKHTVKKHNRLIMILVFLIVMVIVAAGVFIVVNYVL